MVKRFSEKVDEAEHDLGAAGSKKGPVDGVFGAENGVRSGGYLRYRVLLG